MILCASAETVHATPQGVALLWRAVALAWMAALGLPASAAPLSGQVTAVIDGDSLVFSPAGSGSVLEVRLHGLDAPEACQAGGAAARRFLAAAVLGKPATLQTQGRDVYGRTLGVLTVDGQVINARLVAEGHAWSARVWRPSSAEGRRSDGRAAGPDGRAAGPDDRAAGPYAAQEAMAQALRRGVHAERGAMFPWEFRRQHGPCSGAAEVRSRPGAADAAATRPPGKVVPPQPARGAGAFRCDGRTLCTQMHSCAEAEYFLAHCPGVKLDGNRDGVPCESQWCSARR